MTPAPACPRCGVVQESATDAGGDVRPAAYCWNCGLALSQSTTPETASPPEDAGAAVGAAVWDDTPLPPGSVSPTFAAALLNEARGWVYDGIIDLDTLARLQERYSPAYAHVPAQIARSRVGRVSPGGPSVTPPPIVPAGPPGESLGEWAAKRQADILLYLGAFLLSVAALIFVSYQGDALPPAARVLLLGAYTVGFLTGGIGVRRWERVREAGAVFFTLGALLVPLNAILVWTELLDGHMPGDLYLLIAALLCLGFYGVLAVRGFGRLYAVPAGIALLVAWGALASVVQLPWAWAGVWYMLLVLAVALLDRWRRVPDVVGAIAAGVGVLSLLHSSSSLSAEWPGARLQVPVCLALVLLIVIVVWWSRRPEGLIPAGAVTALALAISLRWYARVDASWDAALVLALGFATVLLRPVWTHLAPSLVRGGWPFAALWSLGSFLTTLDEGGDALGALTAARGHRDGGIIAAFLAGAALLALIAVRNTHDGIAAPQEPGVEPVTPGEERLLYGWAAVAYAFAALAVTQRALGVPSLQTGWAFLAVAVGATLLPALVRRFSSALMSAALPVAAIAMIVALGSTGPSDGRRAIMLATEGAALLVLAVLLRQVLLTLLVAALDVAAVAELWRARGWEPWTLAVLLAAVGLVFVVTLARWRTYRGNTESELASQILTWGMLAAALLTAIGTVNGRAVTDARVILVHTVQYRTFVALVLLFAPVVAFEGLRLGMRRVWLPVSAIVMASALLALAILRPASVQAYTAPLGVYLLVLGLVVRRSPLVAPPHVALHELATIAGAVFLLLPQGAQSFEPGGSRWGLVVIAEGLLLLAVGFVLRARWHVVAGVLGLGGVAVRWLAEASKAVPYWLTLGVVGTALLGVGLLLLLERDRWDAARARASRWWQETPVA